MRILGIDFGDTRTGLAISDENEILSQSIGTVTETDYIKTAKLVSEKVIELGAKKIILGLPKNMDGSLGFRADKTMKFKEELEKHLSDIEIVLFDERCTTLAATYFLNETNTRGKKRKNAIDTLSAKIILQDFLDQKKNK